MKSNQADSIASYEEFCVALKSGNEIANLILSSRSWINAVCDFDSVTGEPVYQGLYEFMETVAKSELKNNNGDRVSRISEFIAEAFRELSENLRNKIIRENILMPINKAREINSAGVNWLSRKTGRTVREKLSNTLNILAVNHRESLDTGENRVFLAFVKLLNDLLNLKSDNFGDFVTETETELHSHIIRFLRNDILEEVKPLTSFTPNNTLLSDKNYRKVLDAWRILQKLDENTAFDYANHEKESLNLLFWRTLTVISTLFDFPQIPVTFDYDGSSAKPIYESVSGIYTRKSGSEIYVKTALTDDCFSISVQNRISHVHVNNTNAIIETESGESPVVLSLLNIDLAASKIVQLAFNLNRAVRTEPPATNEKSETIFNLGITDIYSVRPNYIIENGREQIFPRRLLWQEHTFGDESYGLWCDKTNAIMLGSSISSVTMREILSSDDKSTNSQAIVFAEKIKETINANKLIYIFPDLFDEFQLGTLRKSINFCYKKSEPLPRSIAGIFAWQKSRKFQELNFRSDDCVVFVDIVDELCSLTLIKANINEVLTNDISETKGIVWERHPTKTVPIDELLSGYQNDILNGSTDDYKDILEVFSIDELKSEKGNLSVYNADTDKWRHLSGGLSGEKKINLTKSVTEFLARNHQFTQGHNVIVLVNGANIEIDRCGRLIQTLSQVGVCTGVKNYTEWSALTEETLWQDYLPNLSIKLLYGLFPLVDNAVIKPSFGKKQNIEVKGIFTLPKGQKEYRLQLVKGDIGTESKYEAFIKSNAFPLQEDTPCKLLLTYSYGADDPYELVFAPVEKQDDFFEARVEWQKIKKYPVKDLPYPGFPPKLGWDELQSHPRKDGNGTSNLLEWISGTISRYEHLDDTKTVLDKYCERYTMQLSDFNPYWRSNDKGYFCFVNPVIDGEIKSVAIYQSNFDIPEEFSTNYFGYITFSFSSFIDKNTGKEKCNARYIRVGNGTESEKLLNEIKSERIRRHEANGDSIVQSKSSLFAFHTVFSRGYSLRNDPYCPREFREKVIEFAPTLYTLYNSYPFGRGVLFSIMCLTSDVMQECFYPIAFDMVERCRTGKGKLPDNVGIALGDYTTDYQKDLCNRILGLPEQKVICVLSSAVWKNENFVFNAPPYMLLEYFDKAVNFLADFVRYIKLNIVLYQSAINDRREVEFKLSDVSMNLSYVLAIFRLRALDIDNINEHLSMNHKSTRILYSIIEEIINILTHNNLEIRSYLRLEVEKGEQYFDIPDLFYALLLYITGDTGANSLRISEVDDSE